MKQLSDLAIGQTIVMGANKRPIVLHTLVVRNGRACYPGTWQRVGEGCPLVDFFTQEHEGGEVVAFRIIGQGRRI